MEVNDNITLAARPPNNPDVADEDAAPPPSANSVRQGPGPDQDQDAPAAPLAEPAKTNAQPDASPHDQSTAVQVETSQPSVQPDEGESRTDANVAPVANGDKPSLQETANGQAAKGMETPGDFVTPTQRGSGGSGRGSRRAGFVVNGDDGVHVQMGDDAPQRTPTYSGRGRPRGRVGRPRGSGRGRSGGRGGKRKRNDDEDEDDNEDGSDSASSDEVTPIATMTKSGRSVQKPTSFVPPPASPSTNKRKRTFSRRNPESAVCKICLRGTSPATNMIVFCDGCNAPYHRWCHHPPIEQAVVDEVDREWFCKQCESERVLPVPEAEVASFINAEGASAEQRQKYFSSLPPGMLVTLLTKATTLHPDLPLFDPEFRAKQQSASTRSPSGTSAAPTSSVLPPPQPQRSRPAQHTAGEDPGKEVDPDSKYGPDVHPSNYPRPGQGLMRTLPPEKNDLHYLVDDEDKFGVFTHIYQTDPAAANAHGNNRGNEQEHEKKVAEKPANVTVPMDVT